MSGRRLIGRSRVAGRAGGTAATATAPLTTVSAGSDDTYSVLTGSYALNGSVSDGVAPYTYAWSCISRPTRGTYSLSNSAVASPTITLRGAIGEYRFRVTVTDSVGRTGTDEVVITVPTMESAFGSSLKYLYRVDDPASGNVTLAGTDNNEIGTLVERVAGGAASASAPSAANRPVYFRSGTPNGQPALALHENDRWLEGVVSNSAANRYATVWFAKFPLASDRPDTNSYFAGGLRSAAGAGSGAVLRRVDATTNTYRFALAFTGGTQTIDVTSQASDGNWHSFGAWPYASGAIVTIDGVTTTPDATGSDTMIATDRVWFGDASGAVSGGEVACFAVLDIGTTDHRALWDAYMEFLYGPASTADVSSPLGSWAPTMMNVALYTSSNGRTHFGGGDNVGINRVWQYTHATGALVGTQVYDAGAQESHRVPVLLRRASDGRLLTFYSHGTALQEIAYRISTNPDDSTSWGAESLIAHGLGSYYASYYLQPFQLLGETNSPIYLFFKSYVSPSASDFDQYYVKSTNGGTTWSAPVKVIDGNGQRPYMVVTKNGEDRFDLLLSRGHPNEVPAGTNGAYHAYYQGGSYYKTDGTLIGSTAFNVDAATSIFDGSAGQTFPLDIAIVSGKPVVLYQYSVSRNDLRYVYAKWNGSAWVKTEFLASAPFSVNFDLWIAGGYGCLSADGLTAYVGRKVNGQIEQWRYTTADGGSTFSGSALTSDSPYMALNCRVVRNNGSDIEALYFYGARAGALDNFKTQIRAYPSKW